MAIAYVASANTTYSSTTSQSVSLNAGSADNRLLIVGVYAGAGVNISDATLTYNGTSCTYWGTVNSSSVGDMFIWYLFNPSSGSNTLAYSRGSATYVQTYGIVYSGVRQNTFPDASTTGTGTDSSSPHTTNLASVAASCWHTLMSVSNVGQSGAYTGSTQRLYVAPNDGVGWYDSNSANSGAYTVGYTYSGTAYYADIAFTLAPYVDGVQFDAGTQSYKDPAGTSMTWTHTCGSGSNRMLIVGVSTIDTPYNCITGATYGGVSMTQVGTYQSQDGTTNRGTYMFYLANPASGANSVVVSSSSSIRMEGSAVSYFNAKQTMDTGFYAQGNDSSNSTKTLTVSSVPNNNSALVAHLWANRAQTASTNTYAISSLYFGGNSIRSASNVDTGSRSLVVTQSDSAAIAYHIVAIATYTATASGPAKLKTRDTIAKASVKTIDGIAIASVKTIDTIGS